MSAPAELSGDPSGEGAGLYRLAADMIGIHGSGAAAVARDNAAQAARAGARETARRWLAVLAAILAAQRRGADIKGD